MMYRCGRLLAVLLPKTGSRHVPEARLMNSQVRHGAAMGLREILSSQASSAGMSMPLRDHPSGEIK